MLLFLPSFDAVRRKWSTRSRSTAICHHGNLIDSNGHRDTQETQGQSRLPRAFWDREKQLLRIISTDCAVSEWVDADVSCITEGVWLCAVLRPNGRYGRDTASVGEFAHFCTTHFYFALTESSSLCVHHVIFVCVEPRQWSLCWYNVPVSSWYFLTIGCLRCMFNHSVWTENGTIIMITAHIVIRYSGKTGVECCTLY